MLHTVTYRALVIAACGWLLACDASALSLGRPRGAVLIGRPLEITVPVTLDRQETEVPCAGAEVFYGDQKVIRPPTIRWEPGAGTQGNLRILSETAIDEPSVTVNVRVGCAQSSSRRFVLLSEVPPENEASLPIVRSAPPAVRPLPGLAPEAATLPVLPARPPRRPVQRIPEAAEAPVVSKAKRPERAPPPLPTLRLEPLDLSVDRSPTLRLTSELGTQVATDPRNREAAAAMWAALQKGPEEALQDVVRLQGVERELKSLREVTRQNSAAAAQMREQVEQARGERNFASLAVFVLAALLLALLGWLAWRWHHAARVARVGRWFEANSKQVPPVVVQPSPEAVMAAEAAAEAAAIPSPSAWSPSDFQASRSGSVRMVGVDELIDVHDKADFFLSIGETDQAVAVLEAHVHDQVETSALAWMDLLELYHSLGKRVEFERLRSEFSERFTAQVPDFEHFDQPSASLENYSRALSRIVALWPSRRVLEVIEESIFRRPGMPGSEPFSLEAYRELVLLYHVAREVAPAEQSRRPEARPTSFGDTSLQPLNMLETQQFERAGSDTTSDASSAHDMLMIPPASSRLGVDIDLTGGDDEGEAAAAGDDQLPPLDFDMSEFDDMPEDAGPKRR